MTDKSVSHQRATLTVEGGKSYSGFTSVDVGEHSYPMGRLSPAGAKGDLVTIGMTKQGADHTLTHPWHKATYAELRRAERTNAALDIKVIENNGATEAVVRELRGKVGAVNIAGYDSKSGEPLTFTVKYHAHGDDS
jgi:hypothetical protein